MKSLDLGTIANIATALTLIVAAVFGLLEYRTARRERQERAAFAVVSAIMTPEWSRSVVIVQSLPENATLDQMESNPQALNAAHFVGIINEGLGYSVFRGLVPLRTVDELVGGAVRVAWRKMKLYVESERGRSGSQKSWEWFEWLAEQLDRHRPAKTSLAVGAQEAYRDWKPPD
jgi:hypothetical protein